MTSCVFCAIADGSAPSRQVYADDDVLGFLDIRPVTRGHTLLIPRTHAANLAELDPEIGARVFKAGQRLAAAMRASKIAADGVNLLVNDGRAAMQTVFHSHLHVVPRHDGDKLSFAKGLVVRRDPNPDETAAMIRAGVAALR
ncbi:HIT family protein [Gordonia sp. TBRC 11910]|uniref:HIT family protein n=1 Tax=Gordonia asplenii TaxID=2725283 RepID=A0A848KYE0_9ACTN|nr:HIT family protein [Gordonia asplenii]NMO03754.1 HIT family protein [Gordonia asplenii]